MAKEKKEHPHALALREQALSYPETEETFPWGHRVMKVRKKSFVFFGGDDETFSLSVKLPHSAEAALTLPFAEPTGYGLAKSGWVTARFPAGKALPLPVLRAWIDESYRAIAPKTLVKQLDGAPSAKKARAGKKEAPRRRPSAEGVRHSETDLLPKTHTPRSSFVAARSTSG